jgi:RNA 3'-terminal phosphate cyclase (ATP)
LLPLTRAASDSWVEIIGGTHVAWSPTFEYIDEVWLGFMRSIGYLAEVEMKQAGYFPKGGGRIVASIHPSRATSGFRAEKSASTRELRGISLSSNLPDHVAERQRKQIKDRLGAKQVEVEVSLKRPQSPWQGSAVFIGSTIEPPTFGFSALGERCKRAERVSNEAIDMLFEFQESEAALDRFLADQVLIPLALVPARSRFSTEIVTGHLQTNAEVVRKFLDVQITISDEVDDQPAIVDIAPRSSGRSHKDSFISQV